MYVRGIREYGSYYYISYQYPVIGTLSELSDLRQPEQSPRH